MSDTTLNQFLSRGTSAARIATVPAPPTVAAGAALGYFWFETDTGNTYSWSGTAWVKVNQLNIPGFNAGWMGGAGTDGEDGEPGAPGATGPAGATGPQGPAGSGGTGGWAFIPVLDEAEDGAIGPQGATGATGAAGGAGAASIPVPGGTAALGKRVAWTQKSSGASSSVMASTGFIMAHSAPGGLSGVVDANGFWLRLPTAATIGSIAQSVQSDSFTAGSLLPKLVLRFRSGNDLTSQRFLHGVNEQVDAVLGGTVDVDSPGATQRGFYFRYSTSAGDVGFMAMSRDTAGLTVSAQIGANIVASTIYVLTLTVISTSQVRFDVNGTSVDITTNIPTTTALGLATTLSALATSSRRWDIESSYIESN